MKYAWKVGAHAIIRDAQAVGERLERLRRDHGGVLTPEAVVIDAQSPRSVLHGAFEWDDAAAASAYRLVQARELIRAVVVIQTVNDQKTPIRAFVVVSNEEHGHAYTSIKVALRDPQMRAEVLSRARSELTAWRERYRELEEFAELFDVIDSSVGKAS